MEPGVFFRVIGRQSQSEAQRNQGITIKPAILHKYTRKKVQYASFPAIVPDVTAKVRGIHVAGLSEHEVERLDSFEGFMYDRKKVRVFLLDGRMKESQEVETEAYVWSDPHRKGLEDKEWSFEEFRKHKLSSFLGDSSSSSEGADDGFDAADSVTGAAQEQRQAEASRLGRGANDRRCVSRGRGQGRTQGQGGALPRSQSLATPSNYSSSREADSERRRNKAASQNRKESSTRVRSRRQIDDDLTEAMAGIARQTIQN